MKSVSFFILIFVLGLMSFSSPVFAQDQASANFQSLDNSMAPAIANQQSANFQITGGLDQIVGNTQSANFQTVSGVPLPGAAPSPSVSGSTGNGGGGASTIPVSFPSGTSTIPYPTLAYRPWTFLSIGQLDGARSTDLAHILVNGSEDGVQLLTGKRWHRDIPLFLGWNEVYVQQRIDAETSGLVRGMLRRRLTGDVNDDRKVDDLDLSLFTRAWKTYRDDADFNQDLHIDDIDLSLLVAHWAQSY